MHLQETRRNPPRLASDGMDNSYFNFWQYDGCIASVLVSFRDTLCYLDDDESSCSKPIGGGISSPMFLDTSLLTIQHNDSLSTHDRVNDDPDKTFEEQLEKLAALRDMNASDAESCASSISSGESSVSFGGQPPVQVSFVDHGSYSKGILLSADTDGMESVGTGKTEKSARFNEKLNTTREYVPPAHHNLRKYRPRRRSAQDDDYYDFPDHQSEGGRLRPWSTSLKLLDIQRFDCRVLGTTSRDESSKPHVLSAAIIDALQNHLPFTKRGERFWLKYSLVRDGSSLQTLLNKVEGADYNVLAVETMDGEVFGAMTARPWKPTYKYYGSPESFLWRLSEPRRTDAAKSETAILESELEVFPFAGRNFMVQICSPNRLAVGGGTPSGGLDSDEGQRCLSERSLQDWGFGLAFGNDLQEGSSSPCYTFDSPSLSKIHSDGSIFEVANLEVWTLTPCTNIQDAERLSEGLQVLVRCPTI